MLQMPSEYVAVPEEEMVYLDGGGIRSVFKYLIGDWLHDCSLSEFQSVFSQVANQMSIEPVISWFTAFPQRSIGSMLMFFVGTYYVSKTVIAKWKE